MSDNFNIGITVAQTERVIIYYGRTTGRTKYRKKKFCSE